MLARNLVGDPSWHSGTAHTPKRPSHRSTLALEPGARQRLVASSRSARPRQSRGGCRPDSSRTERLLPGVPGRSSGHVEDHVNMSRGFSGFLLDRLLSLQALGGARRLRSAMA